MEITLEQVMAFLAGNAENEAVQNFLNSQVTEERVNAFLDCEKGWSILQPRFDKQFNKSLDSWKNKNLQKIIDDEIRQRYPDETPESKRMREMEQKIAKMEQEKLASEMRNFAITEGNDLGLPAALSSACIGDSQESTRAKLKTIETEFKAAVEREVEARLSRGYRPRGGRGAEEEEIGKQKYEDAIKRKDPAAVLAAKLGI